jgi:hypothetical protein
MSNLLITAVPFHADRLLVVERDGEPFVPMKPIAEAMGLAWQAQHAKLKANPARWGITEIVIPSAGGEQAMSCLPLPRVFGWLMTISPNKVKPELREKVIAYQTECDRVLWQHWSGRHRKAETQAEKYWFGRRPHWKAVRTLVFEGSTYAQAGQSLNPPRSAASVGYAVRRMMAVGLINPVEFIRLRYYPQTAQRLIAANKQMCLNWGVAA